MGHQSGKTNRSRPTAPPFVFVYRPRVASESWSAHIDLSRAAPKSHSVFRATKPTDFFAHDFLHAVQHVSSRFRFAKGFFEADDLCVRKVRHKCVRGFSVDRAAHDQQLGAVTHDGRDGAGDLSFET